jgi:membrane glycosyltransferase
MVFMAVVVVVVVVKVIVTRMAQKVAVGGVVKEQVNKKILLIPE